MVGLETNSVNCVLKPNINFNLVHFCDIQEWYSMEEDIVVEFDLDKKMKGSSFDWVGLFREDWETFESYTTFQPGFGTRSDSEYPRRRKVTFQYNRQLIDSIMLEFKYQFVYVNKYLDILGVSSVFGFMIPLKNYLSKETRMLPSSYNSMTLAEELLVSENPQGSKNHITTCRFHGNSIARNAVTTCSHCRPCGHDYYTVKEKTEFCYLECLRLSEKISDLECEVAIQSLKLDKTINTLNKNSSTNLISLKSKSDPDIEKESDLTSDVNKIISEISSSNCSTQNPSKLTWNSNNFHQMDDRSDLSTCLHSGVESCITQNDKNKNRSDLINKEMKFRNGSVRNGSAIKTLSYPPNNSTSDYSKRITSEFKDIRKCLSEDKVNINEHMALADVNSPLTLKAIIGLQEEKIRRLTQLLNQPASPEDSKGSLETLPEKREVEEVKVVKAELRMLAQIHRINSNSEVFTNESELSEERRLM